MTHIQASNEKTTLFEGGTHHGRLLSRQPDSGDWQVVLSMLSSPSLTALFSLIREAQQALANEEKAKQPHSPTNKRQKQMQSPWKVPRIQLATTNAAACKNSVSVRQRKAMNEERAHTRTNEWRNAKQHWDVCAVVLWSPPECSSAVHWTRWAVGPSERLHWRGGAFRQRRSLEFSRRLDCFSHSPVAAVTYFVCVGLGLPLCTACSASFSCAFPTKCSNQLRLLLTGLRLRGLWSVRWLSRLEFSPNPTHESIWRRPRQ